jgi:hypothetical protein
VIERFLLWRPCRNRSIPTETAEASREPDVSYSFQRGLAATTSSILSGRTEFLCERNLLTESSNKHNDRSSLQRLAAHGPVRSFRHRVVAQNALPSVDRRPRHLRSGKVPFPKIKLPVQAAFASGTYTTVSYCRGRNDRAQRSAYPDRAAGSYRKSHLEVAIGHRRTPSDRCRPFTSKTCFSCSNCRMRSAVSRWATIIVSAGKA